LRNLCGTLEQNSQSPSVHLFNKLMEYVLFRTLGHAVRPAINQILKKVKIEKLGFQDTILAIAESKLLNIP